MCAKFGLLVANTAILSLIAFYFLLRLATNPNNDSRVAIDIVYYFINVILNIIREKISVKKI